MQGVRIRSECAEKILCRIVRELTQTKGVGTRERLKVHRALYRVLKLGFQHQNQLIMACKSSFKGIDDAPFWLSRAPALICTAHTYA